VPIPDQIACTELGGKAEFSVFEPEDIDRFQPIDDVAVPAGDAYLITDVHQGAATVNVTPNKALPLL
jgi:hypothetical protein